MGFTFVMSNVGRESRDLRVLQTCWSWPLWSEAGGKPKGLQESRQATVPAIQE